MISFFRAPIRNIAPQAQVTVQQIYKYITSDYAKLATERLRSIADHGEARRFKAEMFDYVTFSGHFRTRQTSGLIEHSGFLCFDIDKIDSEERLQNIKAQLIADEKLHTVLLFRSPSGNGLKWVVEVPDRYWLRQITDNRVQITDDSLTEDMSLTEPTVLSLGEKRTELTEDAVATPAEDRFINDLSRSEKSSSVDSVNSVSNKNNSVRNKNNSVSNSEIDTITQNHRTLYERIRQYLLDEYGIVTDHTSDIPRPCYLPHDDDAFYDEPTFHANPAHPFLTQSRDAIHCVSQSRDTAHPFLTQSRDTAPKALPLSQGEWLKAEGVCQKSVAPQNDTETLVREIEKKEGYKSELSVPSVGDISPEGMRSINSVDSVDFSPRLKTVGSVRNKNNSVRTPQNDTETLVREIEKRRIDITGDYLNWIRIAFALASKHGAPGEEYFHRISQFHHAYDPQEAHKVYTSCLRNNSGAVTIGTIIYLMNR